MSRVMVYVDGFNLYFGLRSKGWRKYYWLDLHRLATALLKPDQTLVGVHYFTSRLHVDGEDTSTVQRQNAYLDALATLPTLQIHYGHFLEKTRNCKKCGAIWQGYEEKMTDVNIATQLLLDAFKDQFDTALLISGDSDLTTPVRTLRAHFPEKRLIVAFPPDRRSAELIKAANASFPIGEIKIRQSQLPQEVLRADGFVLRRPDRWR